MESTTYKIRKVTDDDRTWYELLYGTSAVVTIRETGGDDGPIAKLYEVMGRMTGITRQGRVGVNISKENAMALLLSIDAFKSALEMDIRNTGVLEEVKS